MTVPNYLLEKQKPSPWLDLEGLAIPGFYMSAALICIDGLIAWFWVRIKRSARVSTRALAQVRIIVGVLFVLFALPNYCWIARVPGGWFKPPLMSLAYFCPGFPSLFLCQAIEIVSFILMVGIMLGVKARILGFLLVIIYGAFSSFLFSLGKIDHTILPWVSLLCLSFSNWGCRLALIPDRPWRFQWRSPALLALLICFGFFTAGFRKFFIWIDFRIDTGGVINWIYPGYFDLGRTALLAEWGLRLPPILSEVMDYLGVAFELSSGLFLLADFIAWRFWLTCACAFHLTNLLLLNIPFTQNAIAYVPFLLSPLLIWKIRHQSPVLNGLLSGVAVFLAVFFFLRYYFPVSGAQLGLLSGYGSAIVVWAVVMGVGVFGIMISKRRSVSQAVLNRECK